MGSLGKGCRKLFNLLASPKGGGVRSENAKIFVDLQVCQRITNPVKMQQQFAKR